MRELLITQEEHGEFLATWQAYPEVMQAFENIQGGRLLDRDLGKHHDNKILLEAIVLPALVKVGAILPDIDRRIGFQAIVSKIVIDPSAAKMGVAAVAQKAAYANLCAMQPEDDGSNSLFAILSGRYPLAAHQKIIARLRDVMGEFHALEHDQDGAYINIALSARGEKQ